MTIELYIEGIANCTQIGYALFCGDASTPKLNIKNQDNSKIICDITDEVLTFPDGIEKIILFKNIDAVDESIKFTSIEFPNSVKSIKCSSSILDLSDGLTKPNFLFKDVKSVYFSKNLEFISNNSFSYIEGLERVVFDLEAPISFIPNSCFRGCHQLHTVVLPNKVEIISYDSFFKTKIKHIKTREEGIGLLDVIEEGCLSIPQTLDYILDYAFMGVLLESVILPDSLIKIGPYALDMSKDKIVYVEFPRNIDLMESFCINMSENSDNTIVLPDYIDKYNKFQVPLLNKLISNKNEILGSIIVVTNNFMFTYDRIEVNTSELEDYFNFNDSPNEMKIHMHLDLHVGRIIIGNKTKIKEITFLELEKEIVRVRRSFSVILLDDKGNITYKLNINLYEIEEQEDVKIRKSLLNLTKDLINEPDNVFCDEYILNMLECINKDTPLTLLNILYVAMQLGVDISKKLSSDALHKLLSYVITDISMLISNLIILSNENFKSDFPDELINYINNNLNKYTIEIEDLEDILNRLVNEPNSIKNSILNLLYNITEI